MISLLCARIIFVYSRPPLFGLVQVSMSTELADIFPIWIHFFCHIINVNIVRINKTKGIIRGASSKIIK